MESQKEQKLYSELYLFFKDPNRSETSRDRAWELTYNYYRTRLKSHLRRYNIPDQEHDDLISSALMNLFEKESFNFLGLLQLRSWLIKVARGLWAKKIRTSLRHTSLEDRESLENKSSESENELLELILCKLYIQHATGPIQKIVMRRLRFKTSTQVNIAKKYSLSEPSISRALSSLDKKVADSLSRAVKRHGGDLILIYRDLFENDPPRNFSVEISLEVSLRAIQKALSK